MDYEKLYKEALERAKRLEEKSNGMILKKWLWNVFPELKESEDERIKKVLIDYFNRYKEQEECGINTFYGISTDNILSWLEKQGELKSSKWTEGDVVRHGGILALVTNGRRAMKSNYEYITIQYPDEWVKANPKERKHFFEEFEKQNKQKPRGKSALEVIKEEKADNINKVVPRFKKGDLVTNGYCRCKIESVDDTTYYCDFTNIDIKDKDKWMLVEQKADCSEEDERIRKHLISLVKNWDKDGIVSKYTSDSKEIKQILAWLEKQSEQVNCSQNLQERR